MFEVRAPLRLVTCEAGRRFASAVARGLGQPLVESRESWFACGEGKLEICENVRGCDVYVFQSPVGPEDSHSVYDRFTMLLHAVEAAALADSQTVTAVLPYFPGARQDKRKGRTREGISAGLFARTLEAAGAQRVLTVEIHNPAIGGMFHPARTTLENVFLTHQLSDWLRARGLVGDVVVAPDVGGMERARRYAAALSADLATLSKERDYSQPNRVKRSELIGDVAGRDVLLVDDMIDTAGSMVAAVDELRGQGARNITLACVHAVFSGLAWERLGGIADRASAEGWRFRVVGTSSIHHVDPPEWYLEHPIEELVAKVIRNINARWSVTQLDHR